MTSTSDDNQKFDRVVAYIRKSSEDNKDGEAHKQLNSLEYQLEFARKAPQQYQLKPIIKTFKDDKTGYEAYVRDGFGDMLTFLEDHRGEIDGIVCTEISRLARNFGDGGKILWFLQSGLIKRIYTPSKVFTDSSSDQLMVAIEFAMSKKSSDETGIRTKAGMRSKANNMKHPARPPVLGYKTEGPTGQKKWLVDSVTGPLVKRVFEQFATGEFTFEQIADFAYDIGLRSNNSKTTTGKFSKNTWRNRLIDIQYTGIFYHEGGRIKGEYEPLISSELFYRVQEVLSDNEHPKETLLDYAYSNKLIKCGLCGGWLSGTHKKGITYYRCGKKNSPCKEIKRTSYVTESNLENDLMKAFGSIELDEEGWSAGRGYVTELNQPELIKIKAEIRKLGEKISVEKQAQINIGRKFSSGEITKGAYDSLTKDSELKEASLKNTVIKCENIERELDDLMNAFLDNIKYVTERLRIALPHNKREMVDIFCENLVWKDGKLGLDWKKAYYIFLNQPINSTMLPHQDSLLSRG